MPYEKSWQFDANRGYSPVSALDLTRYQLWYIKAFLKGDIGGATQGLWTVLGSSDGVTGAMDGVDRWGGTNPYDSTTIGSKIVRAASTVAHSWIVLQSPVINGVQVVLGLDFLSGSDDKALIYCYRTPHTSGGTVSAAPYQNSAGKTWIILGSASSNTTPTATTNAVALNDATVSASRVCAGLTTEGSFYLVWSKNNSGLPSFGLVIMGVAGYKVTDAFPLVTWNFYKATSKGCFDAAGTNGIFYGQSSSINNVGTRVPNPTSTDLTNNIVLNWYANNTNSPIIGTALGLDTINSTYPDLPVWVSLLSTGANSNFVGIRGRIPDLSLAQDVVPQGSIDALTVTKASFGNLWLPINTAPNFGG